MKNYADRKGKSMREQIGLRPELPFWGERWAIVNKTKNLNLLIEERDKILTKIGFVELGLFLSATLCLPSLLLLMTGVHNGDKRIDLFAGVLCLIFFILLNHSIRRGLKKKITEEMKKTIMDFESDLGRLEWYILRLDTFELGCPEINYGKPPDLTRLSDSLDAIIVYGFERAMAYDEHGDTSRAKSTEELAREISRQARSFGFAQKDFSEYLMEAKTSFVGSYEI